MRGSPPEVRALTGPDADRFVGAGPRVPWAPSGRYVLATEVPPDFLPLGGEARVGIIDLGDGYRWRVLNTTTDWDWEGGARALWVPESPDQILCGFLREGRPETLHMDLSGAELRILPFPVHALSPQGARAFSVDPPPADMIAGHRQREQNPKRWISAAANTGIWSIDLPQAERHLVFSHVDLLEWTGAEFGHVQGFWVEQLHVNPEGTRLGFLHHVSYATGCHSHLITCSLSGSRLYCVTRGAIERFAWGPGGMVVAWCGPKVGRATLERQGGRVWRLVRRVNRLLGEPAWLLRLVVCPLLCRRLDMTYRLFRDGEGERLAITHREEGWPQHFSVSPDGRFVLVERSPDASHRRAVYVLHTANGQRKRLAQFVAPLSVPRRRRCVLFPRWRFDMKAILIDSCHEGRRRIYEMDIAGDFLNAPPAEKDELGSLLMDG